MKPQVRDSYNCVKNRYKYGNVHTVNIAIDYVYHTHHHRSKKLIIFL